MRFCDLFIAYKIGLKEIKSTIPFTKLPLYRKVAVVSTFVISMAGAILLMLKCLLAAYITFALGIISLIIFVIIDSRKRNLETMLKDYYTPYSINRMDMVINVLYKYKVNVADIDTIDLLIDEARCAQMQSDYLALLKTPLKILGAIIIPIIIYVAQKIGDNTSQDEMLTMALQVIIITIMFFSLVLSVALVVKDLIYRDYNKYNDLISDLIQIKIFYSKK